MDMDKPAAKDLLLFELDGILMEGTPKGTPPTGFKTRILAARVRPQVEQLLRLQPRYRLGIFSSCCDKTLKKGLGQLQHYFNTNSKQMKAAGLCPPLGGQIQQLFEVQLHQENCVYERVWNPDAPADALVKTLALNGLDPAHTLLIDTHLSKANPEEAASVVVMPEWQDLPDQGQICWHALVDQLLLVPEHQEDLRAVVPEIALQLSVAAAATPAAAAAARGWELTPAVVAACAAAASAAAPLFHKDQAAAFMAVKAAALDAVQAAIAAGVPVTQPVAKKLNPKADQKKKNSALVDEVPGPGYPTSAQPLYGEQQLRGMVGLPSAPSEQQDQLSALHHEICWFAKAACPTPEQMQRALLVVRLVDKAASSIWPGARALLYGSQAMCLGLPGVDLDILVEGVVGPEVAHPPGSAQDKALVIQFLGQLRTKLESMNCDVSFGSYHQSRAPVLRGWAQLQGWDTAVNASISLTNRRGLQLVSPLRKAVLGLPQLRPLTLVLMTLLREQVLNHMGQGGISSVSLFVLLLAHLHCEGLEDCQGAMEELQQQRQQWQEQQQQRQQAAASMEVEEAAGAGAAAAEVEAGAANVQSHQTMETQGQVTSGVTGAAGGGAELPAGAAAAAAAAAAGTAATDGPGPSEVLPEGTSLQQQQQQDEDMPQAAESQAGAAPDLSAALPEEAELEQLLQAVQEQDASAWDLGLLLVGFLHRFGSLFSFPSDAVSMARGGVLPRGDWLGPSPGVHAEYMFVEDMQREGINLAYGTRNIVKIRALLQQALQTLSAACLESPEAAAATVPAAAAVAPRWLQELSTDGSIRWTYEEAALPDGMVAPQPGSSSSAAMHAPVLNRIMNVAAALSSPNGYRFRRGLQPRMRVILEKRASEGAEKQAEVQQQQQTKLQEHGNGEVLLLQQQEHRQHTQQQQQQRMEAGPVSMETDGGQQEASARSTLLEAIPEQFVRCRDLVAQAKAVYECCTPAMLVHNFMAGSTNRLETVEASYTAADAHLQHSCTVKVVDSTGAVLAAGTYQAPFKKLAKAGASAALLDTLLQWEPAGSFIKAGAGAKKKGKKQTKATAEGGEAAAAGAADTAFAPVAAAAGAPSAARTGSAAAAAAAAPVIGRAPAAAAAAAAASGAGAGNKRRATAATAAATNLPAAAASQGPAAAPAAAASKVPAPAAAAAAGRQLAGAAAGSTQAAPPSLTWDQLYPKCKALVAWLNTIPQPTGPKGGQAPEKTPKLVLSEWAQRRAYTVAYVDAPEDKPPGAKPTNMPSPCTVSVYGLDGVLLHGPKPGRHGRTKKEMQLEAAAALLEHLLGVHRMRHADFVKKPEEKQQQQQKKKSQVGSWQGPVMAAGRGWQKGRNAASVSYMAGSFPGSGGNWEGGQQQQQAAGTKRAAPGHWGGPEVSDQKRQQYQPPQQQQQHHHHHAAADAVPYFGGLPGSYQQQQQQQQYDWEYQPQYIAQQQQPQLPGSMPTLPLPVPMARQQADVQQYRLEQQPGLPVHAVQKPQYEQSMQGSVMRVNPSSSEWQQQGGRLPGSMQVVDLSHFSGAPGQHADHHAMYGRPQPQERYSIFQQQQQQPQVMYPYQYQGQPPPQMQQQQQPQSMLGYQEW